MVSKVVGNPTSNVSISYCLSHVKLVKLVMPFGEIVANHMVYFECDLPMVVSLLLLLIVVLGGGEPWCYSYCTDCWKYHIISIVNFICLNAMA